MGEISVDEGKTMFARLSGRSFLRECVGTQTKLIGFTSKSASAY